MAKGKMNPAFAKMLQANKDKAAKKAGKKGAKGKLPEMPMYKKKKK